MKKGKKENGNWISFIPDGFQGSFVKLFFYFFLSILLFRVSGVLLIFTSQLNIPCFLSWWPVVQEGRKDKRYYPPFPHFSSHFMHIFRGETGVRRKKIQPPTFFFQTNFANASKTSFSPNIYPFLFSKEKVRKIGESQTACVPTFTFFLCREEKKSGRVGKRNWPIRIYFLARVAGPLVKDALLPQEKRKKKK